VLHTSCCGYTGEWNIERGKARRNPLKPLHSQEPHQRCASLVHCVPHLSLVSQITRCIDRTFRTRRRYHLPLITHTETREVCLIEPSFLPSSLCYTSWRLGLSQLRQLRNHQQPHQRLLSLRNGMTLSNSEAHNSRAPAILQSLLPGNQGDRHRVVISSLAIHCFSAVNLATQRSSGHIKSSCSALGTRRFLVLHNMSYVSLATVHISWRLPCAANVFCPSYR
jgi:hypothetical protein